MPEVIISKKCCHCKQIKPFSEFYRRIASKDGYQSTCKICSNLRATEYSRTKKGKEIRRRYAQSEKSKMTMKFYRQSERGRATQKHYRLRHPEQIKARSAVYIAIIAGKLPRPDSLPCHYCPKPAKQYHHWHGYKPEHWLDVVPVCKKCHSEHPYHAALIKPARSKKGIIA